MTEQTCVVPSDPQRAEHLLVVRVPAPEGSSDEGVHLDAREALLPPHPLRQGLVLGPLCLPRLLQCVFFALKRDGDVDYQSMFLVRTDDNQVWAAVGRVTRDGLLNEPFPCHARGGLYQAGKDVVVSFSDQPHVG